MNPWFVEALRKFLRKEKRDRKGYRVHRMYTETVRVFVTLGKPRFSETSVASPTRQCSTAAVIHKSFRLGLDPILS